MSVRCKAIKDPFCKRSDIFSPACVRDLVGRLEKFTNDNYEKIKSVLVLNSSSLS